MRKSFFSLIVKFAIGVGVLIASWGIISAKAESILFPQISLPPDPGSRALLRFLQGRENQKLFYDFNRDGIIDKIDLFYAVSRWPDFPFQNMNLEQLQWTSLHGYWNTEGRNTQGETDLDARRVAQESFPTAFEFTIRVRLQEGTGAGAFFWGDASGQIGYVARLDSVLGALVLSRIGPWPEEQWLDQYPWSLADGNEAVLRVATGQYDIRVYCPDRSSFPVLEAVNQTPLGDHLGFYLFDALADFELLEIRSSQTEPVSVSAPSAGDYRLIYDQSAGEPEWWYINDHCFIRDRQNLWHLFGITHPYPPVPRDEDQFAHATAEALTQSPWAKQPFALRTDPQQGEDLLWSPHIIEKDGVYYMFYCAGSQESDYRFRIHLATSTDLFHWTRYPNNPLFEDFYDARDPMVLYADGHYILYYTAVLERPAGNHIVAYRTSDDLLHWSPRQAALIHDSTGTYGGPTESPFVAQYGDHFYLFTGPDGEYRRTAVYRSSNPYHWNPTEKVASIPSHAAEVVQDQEGRWYVSHCGWYYQGVYLASLLWRSEPEVRLFTDLGETLDYVKEQYHTFVSPWRNTSALDLTADFDGYFILEFPISDPSKPILLEFEAEGEVKLELLQGGSTAVLLDEGNSGPGIAAVHRLALPVNAVYQERLSLRFSDSDPADGWGPNVNWVRLLW